MALLAIAVLAFALIHLIPAVPPVKARLQQRLGRAYGPVFGIAATVSLVLIAVGWRAAGYVAVYDPPMQGRQVTVGLLLLSFLCLGVFLFRGRLRQHLRFPLAIAVMLWGVGHLFANGDLASLILFGGLSAYAAAHFGFGRAYGMAPSRDVRSGHDVVSLIAGLALYIAMVQLHPILIGVPVASLP
ncbi:MAG TPA: NnrU family protein [Aestuariivirgaceae bacterium]|nr:NnrU family protein [Aestuariivirgaceae bacterium]